MAIVDQSTDRSLRVLTSVLHANPDYVGLLKTATEKEGKDKKTKERELTNKDFAWPESRLFKITTPKDAILSKLYSSVNKGIPPEVSTRIDNALNLHDVSAPEIKKASVKKVAHEPVYMLPRHQKGVIDTTEQLKKAEEFLHLRRHQLDPETKTEHDKTENGAMLKNLLEQQTASESA